MSRTFEKRAFNRNFTTMKLFHQVDHSIQIRNKNGHNTNPW